MAIPALRESNMSTKELTRDNPIIIAQICRDMDLDSVNILIDPDIELMSEKNLSKEVELRAVFCQCPFDKNHTF
ncbi:hypothetical protein [Xenorhabdus poinarii]|uniref:hypothetical protein n=1 Tax=Xenorhabdus poinarii TaxID=40577 RepID=UPI0008FFA0EA|nr:hypothetical protein [Xenorhabdus poinarii]